MWFAAKLAEKEPFFEKGWGYQKGGMVVKGWIQKLCRGVHVLQILARAHSGAAKTRMRTVFSKL